MKRYRAPTQIALLDVSLSESRRSSVVQTRPLGGERDEEEPVSGRAEEQILRILKESEAALSPGRAPIRLESGAIPVLKAVG